MDPVRINSRQRERERVSGVSRWRKEEEEDGSIGSSAWKEGVVNNRLRGVECQLRFNHRGSIGRETGRDITGPARDATTVRRAGLIFAMIEGGREREGRGGS